MVPRTLVDDPGNHFLQWLQRRSFTPLPPGVDEETSETAAIRGEIMNTGNPFALARQATFFCGYSQRSEMRQASHAGRRAVQV